MNASVQENNSVILDLLQEMVDAETTSRNLYFQRSVFWRNVGLAKLAAYYKDQSEENHAQLNADRLAFLGGNLAIEPEANKIISSSSIGAHYEEDLDVEADLANGYQYCIERAEALQDYITSKVWRKVLKSTQEHIAYLQQELKKIELIGEDNYLQFWM